ncbi:hypothetical protein D6833_10560 [Candidatus Parcubacteria bacterium]|nr:MAG: hypothetical protein D6833_10560 [Candidatus Parcubacteria bacterium]
MSAYVEPLVEVNRKAIWALYRELGVVNAVRFLRQFTTGFGDYTVEREVLFGEKRLEEILDEVKREAKGEMKE